MTRALPPPPTCGAGLFLRVDTATELIVDTSRGEQMAIHVRGLGGAAAPLRSSACSGEGMVRGVHVWWGLCVVCVLVSRQPWHSLPAGSLRACHQSLAGRPNYPTLPCPFSSPHPLPPTQFDLTFHHMPCSWISLDAMDVSGDVHLDLNDHDIYKRRLAADGAAVDEGTAHKLKSTHKAPPPVDSVGCGPCYGAEAEPGQCCNTCEEVTGGRDSGSGRRR